MYSEANKEICGRMFEILINKNGVRSIIPTKDLNKAAPIIALDTKKRCPYCSSNMCLANLVYECFDFEGFFDPNINYVDIAKCKKSGKDFLITIDFLFKPLEENKNECMWCGSHFTEAIHNFGEIREKYFLSNNIKKYSWFYDGYYSAYMKGFTADDRSLFIFKNPRRCKHCKRIFGYSLDLEGWEKLIKFGDKVTKKEIEKYLKKAGIEWEVLDTLAAEYKCPFCHYINYEEWLLDFSPHLREYGDFKTSKHMCRKCKKEFFITENKKEDESS